MKTVVILAVGFILSEARVDPGVVGRLTLKGLQYGWDVGLQELQKRIMTLHIPDVEGSIQVPVVGRMYYYVTELQVQSIDFSDSSLTFCPDTGINLSIQQGRIKIAGRIQIRSSIFSGSSWMELLVQGFSVAGSLGITCDDLGHGAVWDAGCSSSVGGVDLWFHGGSGWIFSMFKGSMIGPIQSAISSQICPSFGEAVKQMEGKLSSLPVSFSVDSVSEVDVNLVGPPLITNTSFDLFVKAEFVSHLQHLLPYRPEKLTLPDIDTRMLLLALSQFSVNTAGFVHFKAGFLKLNITDDMVPKQSPIRLNVKSLEMFAPELPTRYPDSPPLLLQVSAHSAPTVSCQPDSLTVQASADLEFFAMYPNQSLISLFHIQADSLTAVDLVLSEQTVGSTILVKNFSLSLVHSDVGTVKVDTMQKIMNVGLKLLLPILNGRLKNIFPLPTTMIRLQNPVVRVMQGYIVIMTDLQAGASRPLDAKSLLEVSNLIEGQIFKFFLR